MAEDGALIAELLVERYPIRPKERVSVRVTEDPLPRLDLVLESDRDRYEIGVQYLRGRDGRDVWLLLADALDGLFGTLIESDRAYHDIPAGSDVELDGAFFRVEVSRTIPELVKQADLLLEADRKKPS